MQGKLYLDDLSAGQIYESDRRTVSQDEIVSFAAQFDPQVFHLDPEGAKSTFFKGLSASGIHTFGISMRLLVESAFYPANGIISTGGDIRWKKPVRAGDTLSLRIEVKEVSVDPKKGNIGTALVHIDTLNRHAEVVQTFITQIVTTRRPLSGLGAVPGHS